MDKIEFLNHVSGLNGDAYVRLADVMRLEIPRGMTLGEAGLVFNAVDKTIQDLNKLGKRIAELEEIFKAR